MGKIIKGAWTTGSDTFFLACRVNYAHAQHADDIGEFGKQYSQMLVFVKMFADQKMKVTDMADGDPRDQIARLESDIEQLADGLDRCRKAMLLSKVAIAGGGIGVLAYFLGPIRFDPAILIGAIAAVVSGVVIFGSNSSTSKQIMAAMKAAEAQRTKLIDLIDPRAYVR